jgi:large subunit ribosomal protein L21
VKLRTAHAYRSETYEGDNILMYAVIVTGGKQYKVAEGDVLYIEKLGVDADSEVTFDNVLAVSTDKGFKAGKDAAKATVNAKVLKNGKGKKITVFTYKPKKNEKRKMGHRQPYTKVEITKINA